MTPFMALWLPIVVSAVAVFILSSIIHMAMPWHKNDYVSVPNEDAVIEAIRPFAIPPGDYMVPGPLGADGKRSPDHMEKWARGPSWMMTMMPPGRFSMGKTMSAWFLFVLLVAAIAGCITGSIVAPGGNDHAVFHYAGVITLLCYTLGEWPLSIWYYRKWSTAMKGVLDGVIYAAATAGIFVLLWPKA